VSRGHDEKATPRGGFFVLVGLKGCDGEVSFCVEQSSRTAAQAIWRRSSLFVLELELDLVEGVDGRVGSEVFQLVAFALAADDLEPTLARCLKFRV